MTIQEFADLIIPMIYGISFIVGICFGTWYFYKLLRV